MRKSPKVTLLPGLHPWGRVNSEMNIISRQTATHCDMLFQVQMVQINMFSFLFFSVRSDGLPSPNSTCDALFPGRTGHPKGTLRSPAANSDLFERVEGAFGCKKYLVPSDSQSLTLTVWHTIEPNGKNPQKVRFKNSWNWLGHSYACNILTNFQYETRACNDRKRKLSISDKTREITRTFLNEWRECSVARNILCQVTLNLSP